MKHRAALGILVTSLLVLTAGGDAWALSCKRYSPSRLLDTSEIVFRGKIFKSYVDPHMRDALVHIKVLDRIKGEVEDEFLATYQHGPQGLGGTAFNYFPDGTILFFFLKKGDSGKAKIGALSFPDLGGICSGRVLPNHRSLRALFEPMIK